MPVLILSTYLHIIIGSIFQQLFCVKVIVIFVSKLSGAPCIKYRVIRIGVTGGIFQHFFSWIRVHVDSKSRLWKWQQNHCFFPLVVEILYSHCLSTLFCLSRKKKTLFVYLAKKKTLFCLVSMLFCTKGDFNYQSLTRTTCAELVTAVHLNYLVMGSNPHTFFLANLELIVGLYGRKKLTERERSGERNERALRCGWNGDRIVRAYR